MALAILGVVYLTAAAIFVIVMSSARGERVRDFKSVSPGMLPPLGILFLDGDPDYPNHYDAIAQSGALYTVEPLKS